MNGDAVILTMAASALVIAVAAYVWSYFSVPKKQREFNRAMSGALTYLAFGDTLGMKVGMGVLLAGLAGCIWLALA